MRIRFSLPLPGPFSLTGGGRRGGGSGLGVLVVVGLLYLGAWFAWPIPTLIATAVVVAIAVAAWIAR